MLLSLLAWSIENRKSHQYCIYYTTYAIAIIWQLAVHILPHQVHDWCSKLETLSPARLAEAETAEDGCLSSLGGENLKYHNVFEIIPLGIIHAYNFQSYWYSSKVFDSCLMYHFQFKLHLLIIRNCQVNQQPLIASYFLMRLFLGGNFVKSIIM